MGNGPRGSVALPVMVEMAATSGFAQKGAAPEDGAEDPFAAALGWLGRRIVVWGYVQGQAQAALGWAAEAEDSGLGGGFRCDLEGVEDAAGFDRSLARARGESGCEVKLLAMRAMDGREASGRSEVRANIERAWRGQQIRLEAHLARARAAGLAWVEVRRGEEAHVHWLGMETGGARMLAAVSERIRVEEEKAAIAGQAARPGKPPSSKPRL